MNSDAQHPSRLSDLLADEATVGLDSAERAELDAMIAAAGLDQDREALEFAAAALDVGIAQSECRFEPLPQRLRTQLLDDAAALAAEPAEIAGRIEPVPATLESRTRPDTGTGPAPLLRWAGWFAAAACLVLAVLAWMPSFSPSPGAIAPELARERLLETPDGIVRASWTPVQSEWIDGEETGDVVWSQERHEGYMRFTGLAANDPTELQYQLWIFQDDPAVEASPVQGGVFNVEPGETECVVAIEPGIRLAKAPIAFAITCERPGGVWVSDRSRLPVLALVPQGED